jgi:hypothetical protein
MNHPDAILPLLALLKRANAHHGVITERPLIDLIRSLMSTLAPVAHQEQISGLEQALFDNEQPAGIFVRSTVFRVILGIPGYDTRELISRVFRDVDIPAMDKDVSFNSEAHAFFKDVIKTMLELHQDRGIAELLHAYLVADGTQASLAKDLVLQGIATFYPYKESIPLLLDIARQYGVDPTEGFRFASALFAKLGEPGALVEVAQRLDAETNPVAQLALIKTLNESKDPRAADALQRFFVTQRNPESSLARENALIAMSRLSENGPVNAYAVTAPMLADIVNHPSEYSDFIRFSAASAVGHLWRQDPDWELQYTTNLEAMYEQSREDETKNHIVDVLGRYGTQSALDYLRNVRQIIPSQSESPSDLLESINNAIKRIEERISKK